MIEDDVRTMLRRRAEDVTVTPRSWSELVDAPPVVELRPVQSQRRWIAVAAVVLAVGVAATVLVARRPDPTVPVEQLPARTLPFDPATAAPIFPLPRMETTYPTPEAVASGYLGKQLVGARWELDPVSLTEGGDRGSVRWAWAKTADSDAPASGELFLRRVEERWVVVGAVDDELVFSRPSYRDNRLSVEVAPAPGATTVDSLSATVTVDGAPAFVPGETLPLDGTPDPDAGVLLESGRIDAAIASGGAAVVRVRQVGGGFLSVAEFVVQPEGGPAGGRLLATGTLGDETWRIWAMDRAEGTDETPCVAVMLATRIAAGPLCGVTAGDPADAVHFIQVGPVHRSGDTILYFGAVEAEVDEVWITTDPNVSPLVLQPAVDPLHPAGARFFAASAQARPGAVVNIDPRVNGESTGGQGFPADGPVGG